MIKDIREVEKLASDFLRDRFVAERVHVLQVEYDKDVWTAEGGFITKECPMAIFTVKVDRDGNVLSNKVVCALLTGHTEKRTYG